MTIVPHDNSVLRATAVISCSWVLLVFGGDALVQAQEDVVLQPSGGLEQSSSGNSTQEARMSYHGGVRDLKLAQKLALKASAAEAGEDRDRLHQNSVEAYESAVEKFMATLRQMPEMIEAYDSLGEAFRSLGRYQEALDVHAIALRRDSESMDNFRGWAASLMALNMLGNATQSYTGYVETQPPRAKILMDEMKKWLTAKQTDPGDLDPADVERLATWIVQQNKGG